MKKFMFSILIVFVFFQSFKLANSFVSNEEKNFLRISEKYDLLLYERWKNSIDYKGRLIEEINNKNMYDEYKKYIIKNKNNKLLRLKRKYLKKLNISGENKDIIKIRRYLKLILNIFDKENENLKNNFNLE